MGFTVIHKNGEYDVPYQTYTRALRQQGKNLGRLPRVPEPVTGRRWLPFWPTAEPAHEFARDLVKRTRNRSWEVVEVAEPPSEGPLGPVVIQLVRQSDGLLFAIPPLSAAMIQSAFPEATPLVEDAFISTERWHDFTRTQGLNEYIRQISPSLTGLAAEQLTDLGYAVVDAATNETALFVPPAALAQEGSPSPSAAPGVVPASPRSAVG